MPDFPVYNKCNNKCILCSNPNDYSESKQKFSLEPLLGRIVRFYRGEKEFLDNYRDCFNITGGEPTLSRNLFTIIRTIDNFFPESKIVLLSNGRMFSYEKYARELLSLRSKLELIVSLHGHRAKVHDRITQAPNSFIQTFKGLKNILRFRGSLHILELRVIINRINYKFLEEITDLVQNEFPGINRLVYVFLEIEGVASDNIKELKITYVQLRPYIEKVYNKLRNFQDVRFYHFPFCTLPDKLYPFIWRTLPHDEVSFLAVCKKCVLKKECVGIHKGYLEFIGPKGFKPVLSRTKIRKGNDWHHPVIGIADI